MHMTVHIGVSIWHKENVISNRQFRGNKILVSRVKPQRTKPVLFSYLIKASLPLPVHDQSVISNKTKLHDLDINQQIILF